MEALEELAAIPESLAVPEFVDLAIQPGFEVISKKTHVRPGTLEALAGLCIASLIASLKTNSRRQQWTLSVGNPSARRKLLRPPLL